MSEPSDAGPGPVIDRSSKIRLTGLFFVILIPLGFLIVLSLGSGWTYPNLFPDRIDGMPWEMLLRDGDGLRRSGATSIVLSMVVGSVSTIFGLMSGRAIQGRCSGFWRFFVYLPFVCSPMIASTSLYDLLIRARLVGTMTGVIFSQTIFATAFATIFFAEFWSERIHRLEVLVRSLGGRSMAVWRHVILPEGKGLIVICFCQSALYSWLDYGLVSLIGGGRVVTLPVKFFGYVREGSVNMAAMASLVLVLPVGLSFFLAMSSRVFSMFRSQAKD